VNTPVNRPQARQIHPDDMTRLYAEGKHCDARRPRTCRRAVTVITSRWWWSAAAGRVLVTEHFVCSEHGREFAGRHGIKIGPPPDEPSLRPGPRGGEGGPR
jgi:hypothetical protein